MKIAIGSDHAGFELKEGLKESLTALGHTVEDLGTGSPESCDYPLFAARVAGHVAKGKADRGVLVCGTGIGMSMAANRFPGVRAALCSDIFSVGMSRRHNDSNILVMGGRLIGDILAFELVKTWLETPFEGGRHLDRIRSLDKMD